jgi:hypothetical protein
MDYRCRRSYACDRTEHCYDRSSGCTRAPLCAASRPVSHGSPLQPLQARQAIPFPGSASQSDPPDAPTSGWPRTAEGGVVQDGRVTPTLAPGGWRWRQRKSHYNVILTGRVQSQCSCNFCKPNKHTVYCAVNKRRYIWPTDCVYLYFGLFVAYLTKPSAKPTKQKPWLLLRKRTIRTDRPPGPKYS